MSMIYRRYRAAILMMLVAAFCCTNLIEVHATHLVGGEMTYECAGDGWFKISLTIRRDCSESDNAPFDETALVGVFDGYGTPLDHFGVLGNVVMEMEGEPRVVTISGECAKSCEEELCVEEVVYSRKVKCIFNEAGYVFTYQRCCRNESLDNIQGPLDAGGSWFVCLTEETLLSCNSGPVFREWPDIVICNNEPYSFDHSAVDPDGDSLSYRLYVPHVGATRDFPRPFDIQGPDYETVEFIAPYSLDNVMGGTAPLMIDHETGLVTVTPDTEGQFLIGILVEEWRDGKLLSKVRRNTEINVCDMECRTINLIDTISVCLDEPVLCHMITIDETYTYVWAPELGAKAPVENTVELCPTQEGTFQVTISKDMCPTIVEDIVIRSQCPPQPCTTPELVESIEICRDLSRRNGQAVNVTEGYIYEWDPRLNARPQENNMVVLDPQEEGSFPVTISKQGCPTITRNIIVRYVVCPDPCVDPELVGSIDICRDTFKRNGQAVIVTEGYVYAWDTLLNANPREGNIVVLNPKIEGSFPVTISKQGCPTVTRSIVVRYIICPDPCEAPKLRDSISVCKGADKRCETVTIDTTYTYVWDSGLNAQSPEGNQVDLCPTQEGLYNVTITKDGCDSIVEQIYATVTGPDPNCMSENLVITDEYSYLAGTLRYTFSYNINRLMETCNFDPVQTDWVINIGDSTISGTGTTISGTLDIIDPCVLSMADVTIMLLDGDNCPITINDNIPVVIPPSVNFLPVRICRGDTARLVDTPVSCWTYSWAPEDIATFVAPVDLSNPEIRPDASRNYNVTVTNGDTSISASVFVVVDQPVEVVITADTTDKCLGIVNLRAEPAVGGIQNEWSLSSDFSNIFSSSQDAVVTVDPESTDTTIVYLRSISGTCISRDSIEIAPCVNPLCDPPNPMYELIPCTFGAQFRLDTCYEDDDVLWTFGDQTSTLANPTFTFPAAGMYDVILSSPQSAFEPITIKVTIKEIIELMPQDTTITYCGTDSVVIGVISNIDAEIIWQDQNGDIIGSGAMILVDPTVVTSATAIATDTCNCTDSAIVRLTPDNINISVDAPGAVCESEDFSIFVSSAGSDDLSYEWSGSPELVIEDAMSANPVIRGAMTDPIELRLRVGKEGVSGCFLDTAIRVKVITVDISTDEGPDGCILVGEDITLTASTNATNPTYDWSPTTGSQSSLTDSPDDETIYTVTVTDSQFDKTCTDSDTIQVFPCIWDVPSAFSPNGNNMNETFRVRVAKDRDLSPFNMKILNRWGQEVFSSTDLSRGWDGTFKNKVLAPDVYAYCVQITCPDGSREIKSGNVTLAR